MIDKAGHIGNNSVLPVSVHEFTMDAAEDIRQNICATIRACIKSQEHIIVFTDLSSLILTASAAMPSVNGDIHMQQYYTEFPRLLRPDPPTLLTTLHFGPANRYHGYGRCSHGFNKWLCKH